MEETCKQCKFCQYDHDRFKKKPDYWHCELNDCLCIEIVDYADKDKCENFKR